MAISDFQRYLDEALPKCVLAPEEEDCVKQEPARPQRLIDANTLPVTTITDGGYWTKDVVYKRDIDAAPTVDAVEVVRCKDCRFCKKHPTSDNVKMCTNEQQWGTECYPLVHDDDFCSYGERKDNA